MSNYNEITQDLIPEEWEEETQLSERECRLQQLNDRRINASMTAPDVQYLLEYGGVKFVSTCDYQIMVSKKKQGKTTAMSVLMSAILGSDFCDIHSLVKDATILHIDTEQNTNDHITLLEYINTLCNIERKADNNRVLSYSFIGQSADLNREDLKILAEEYKPTLIVLDGIIQFISDPRNTEESAEVIRMLDYIKKECKCAILVVIHSNKSLEDDNARYELGTNLENGCADRFSTSVSKEGVFEIKHDYSRHLTIDKPIRYYRDRDNNGLPTKYEGSTQEDKRNFNYVETTLAVLKELGGVNINKTTLKDALANRMGRSSRSVQDNTIIEYAVTHCDNKIKVETGKRNAVLYTLIDS